MNISAAAPVATYPALPGFAETRTTFFRRQKRSSSNLRIAFVITRSDAVGGASIHVRDLAKILIESGHTVHVFLGGHGPVTEAYKLAGVPFTSLKGLVREVNPREDARGLIELRKAFKSFKPDIVSTHTSKAGVLGRVAAWSLGIPAIYTPHCWSFVDGFPGAKLYLWAERFARPFGRRIVMVSEAERQDGLRARIGSANHLVTVHNGMPDLGRSSLSRPEQPCPKIVMVGRCEKQKDHTTLLKALATLKDLPWTLECIGDGPLRADYEKLATDLGIRDRVTFAGYRTDVASLLSKAQIFALITNWEGFPRSIIEAMRSGLPVIASDVGGNAESVSHGETGFIVPRGDVKSVALHLRSLVSDAEMRARFGEAGRLRYEEKFTIDRMVENTLAVWSDVLGRDINFHPRRISTSHRALVETSSNTR